MNRRTDNIIVARGKGGIVRYAVQRNGKMPAEEFIADLYKSLTKQKIGKLLVLFQNKANGIKLNQLQFKHLEDEIWQFKSGQVRILCFRIDKDIFLTHGFIKKRDKCPPKEISKAKSIMQEHLNAR